MKLVVWDLLAAIIRMSAFSRTRCPRLVREIVRGAREIKLLERLCARRRGRPSEAWAAVVLSGSF
jgi:hypothetical protein